MRLFDPASGQVTELAPAPGRVLRIAAGDGIRVAVVADLLRRVAERRRWRTGVAGHSSLSDRQLIYLNVHPFQDPATTAELVVHAREHAPPVAGRPVAVAELAAGDVERANSLPARLALLRRHYREPATLDGAALAGAEADLSRWRGLVARWAERPSAPMVGVEAVVERLEDDLDVPGALMALEALAADEAIPPGARFEAFAHLDRLLGLDLASDVGRG